ncbi:YybH family protein [Kineococcus sp. SYSU DK003]|uniref:YybH family protein n=1 Tax=Kineococcus sp. SYSU DK003 TaxID=3383124 RepID=UPI003D7DE2A4
MTAGTTGTTGYALSDLHSQIETRINAKDLDGILAMFSAEASMIDQDRAVWTGKDAIRQQIAGTLASAGKMTIRTRYAVACGDLALLSNDWTLQVGDGQASGTTCQVARRQPDGSWLFLIDYPFAADGPETPESS